MKKNQYNKLIEDLNEVLIKLNINRESLDSYIKEIGEKKLESQSRIDALDDQILSKEVDLNSLQNYKTIIKQMLKKDFKFIGSISLLMILVGTIYGGLPYFAALTLFALGFNSLVLTSFLRESKKIRDLKKNSSIGEIIFEIYNLKSIRSTEKMILNGLMVEEETVKSNLVNTIEDVSIYSDYKKQIMDRYDLASNLCLGKPSHYMDYIYYQDRRSQDIQKLVRERVENQ